MTEHDRHHDHDPSRIDIPQADLDDLQRPPRPRPLARRAARRRRLRRQPVVRPHRSPTTGGTATTGGRSRPGSTRYPQFTTEIDGQNVHFLHVRSPEPNALPLIVTHGWPGSIVEFLDIIDPLTDPRSARRRPGRRVRSRHPVACPGYGFSGPTREPGWNQLPDRRGVGRADAPARLRALRRRRQRRRFDDLAGGRPARPRARRRRPRHPDLLVPVGRPVRVRRHDRGGEQRARHAPVVRREQDVVQHADGAAAADAGLRDQRLAARPARLERPAPGRGPRSGLRALERDAVLADRHGGVGGAAVLRERPRRRIGRPNRRRCRSALAGVRWRLQRDPPLRRARPRQHRPLDHVRPRWPLRGPQGARPS